MSQDDAAANALLEMLVRGVGARRVLEVGTAGDASLCIARALPLDGMLITLEPDEPRARGARARFEEAGVSTRVAVMIGDAARYLHKISGPFDLIVQHASDGPMENLRPRLMQLLRDGGVLATTSPTPEADVNLRVKR